MVLATLTFSVDSTRSSEWINKLTTMKSNFQDAVIFDWASAIIGNSLRIGLISWGVG